MIRIAQAVGGEVLPFSAGEASVVRVFDLVGVERPESRGRGDYSDVLSSKAKRTWTGHKHSCVDRKHSSGGNDVKKVKIW